MPCLLLMCSLQKRQLASQSLAFNIKDKVFCELFPDVVEVRTMPDFLTDVCMSRKHILPTSTLILDPFRPLQTGNQAEAAYAGGAQVPLASAAPPRRGAGWRSPPRTKRPPAPERPPATRRSPPARPPAGQP